ncbi:hypothetical protein [Mesorhizobium sp. M1B.F.Ca.ET.045.04.1.1]|uniref:hypothetical protein n=1 Tax=Mesorhizobium sp. M1B.F.Ca.ET.045.04.1.1 TaxID=2493673 RepID=UPI000F758B35|nr:hypothetical protein [Mesorhizobium sp. M1B.F.Ca.ET.045.04.1.1]AZO29319.1 hypothetical protein EJ071_19325 [Mesorhizobium sp. M1B.F.Ca.ET.045.04.1.1]
MRELISPYPKQIGRRVVHDETRKEGVVVVQPDGDATHVFVLFDGAEQAVPVHPGSIEYVDQAA